MMVSMVIMGIQMMMCCTLGSLVKVLFLVAVPTGRLEIAMPLRLASRVLVTSWFLVSKGRFWLGTVISEISVVN
jgi:hypothetical protein